MFLVLTGKEIGKRKLEYFGIVVLKFDSLHDIKYSKVRIYKQRSVWNTCEYELVQNVVCRAKIFHLSRGELGQAFSRVTGAFKALHAAATQLN